MNYETFKTAMARCAVEVRDEYDVLTLQSYWERFEDWSDEQFIQALKECGRELNRFPTVAQVFSRRYQLKAVNRVWVDRTTYRCLACQDRGGIEVYDPRCYGPARDGSLQLQKLRTVMVACECEAGGQHQKEIKPGEKSRCLPLTKYDPNQMRQCLAVLPTEQLDELTHYVVNEWKPRNYHAELEDWN